ncbi:MAG TPA: hypothetical protein VF144_09505 [Chitinophagaceae bacterium]
MDRKLFPEKEEQFSFESHGVTITCQKLDVSKGLVYHVTFSSNRKPIVIARARFEESEARWTSIPEGRQKEAEGVGALIEQYLSTKK